VGVWRLLVASWMLGAAACGGDEPDAPQAPSPLPEGCRAGELPLEDGACRPAGLPDGEPAAGVPPEGCAAGFEADGDHGCHAIVPERMCGAGKMAVPGDAQCRDIGPCGAAPFGDVSPDGDTLFVVGSYAGADSDGSADKPWTTIQDAIAAAAEGATIAVAAGSYQGPVRIFGKPVRLRGRCASMVEVVAGGEPPTAVEVRADGTEVHGIAMTGGGYGAILSGATEVLFDEVWIHDTAARGIHAEDTLGDTSLVLRASLIDRATIAAVTLLGATMTIERSALRSSTVSSFTVAEGHAARAHLGPSSTTRANLTLVGSHIEDARDAGIDVLGSDLQLEGTLIRDTRPMSPRLPGGVGIRIDDAWPDPPSKILVQSSVLERNVSGGIGGTGADVTVEDTVVRDVTLDAVNDIAFGVGVNYGGGGAQPSTLVVRRTLIDRVANTGVFLRSAQGSLEHTRVRATDAAADGGDYGSGLLATTEPSAGLTARLVVRSCVIEGSRGVGVHAVGADVDMEGTAVRDTQPAPGGDFGIGAAFAGLVDPGAPQVNARVASCAIEGAHTAGVYLTQGTVSMSDTVVRDIRRQVVDDSFGDGLVVLGISVAAEMTIDRSRIERSSRAGIVGLGASVHLANTLLECNPIALDSESSKLGGAQFDDLGGNDCGCGADRSPCTVSSASLAPPAPLPPSP
jgi:hypothetical protein